jgi:peroxiredoxin Q/BCP
MKMRKRVSVGDRAPDFTLVSQRGEKVSLGDYLGKSAVVLFFYPKDNSPGCTKEACEFRDNYLILKEAGAEVLGISSQSEESHGIFSATFALPYLLLSDTDGKVRELYGVPSLFGFLPGRVTYIIDKNGVVRHVFNSQLRARRHAAEALRMVRAIGREIAGTPL